VTTERRFEPIRDWREGDSVVAFVLLSKKEVRQDKSGRDYLDLELSDATGSMVAKAWSDSKALQREFAQHDFVKIKGQVRAFRDQLQFNLDDCRRAVEQDRADGFDETQLMPSTPEDIDDLWRRLMALLATVERPALRRLADETLAVWGPRLRTHPAAKSIHHAYRGGLLEHSVSMAELAHLVAGHYPELDRDLLLLGVLFHDLGKILELGAMPANDYTLEGRLVGHVVLGRDLLRDRVLAIPDFPADLALQLEHLVLSHQGTREFGAAVEPMTPEAQALHFIDDLDSKMNQLRQARAKGPALQWHHALRRYIYFLPAEEAPAPPEEIEQESPAARPEGAESADQPLDLPAQASLLP
jgi:3'-5' exoribonuclease